MRKYKKINEIITPIFDNFDEKFRNEMYSVFRTIQDIMIINMNDKRI
jgi:hypothetical protein